MQSNIQLHNTEYQLVHRTWLLLYTFQQPGVLCRSSWGCHLVILLWLRDAISQSPFSIRPFMMVNSSLYEQYNCRSMGRCLLTLVIRIWLYVPQRWTFSRLTGLNSTNSSLTSMTSKSMIWLSLPIERGHLLSVWEWVISKFNGTSTRKRSHSAKTGIYCPMSLNRVYQKRMLWANECKVQGKMSSHILKKSPVMNKVMPTMVRDPLKY